MISLPKREGSRIIGEPSTHRIGQVSAFAFSGRSPSVAGVEALAGPLPPKGSTPDSITGEASANVNGAPCLEARHGPVLDSSRRRCAAGGAGHRGGRRTAVDRGWPQAGSRRRQRAAGEGNQV